MSSAPASSVPAASAPVAVTTANGQRPQCNTGAGGDTPDDVGASHAWIRMVSATRGYAVIGGTIVGTVDGRQWRVLYPGSTDLDQVDAVGADRVWAVGGGVLLASADGGDHWRVTTTKVPFATVRFTDARNGWAADAGSLWRTRDGGASWRAVPTPCPVDRVCFDSDEHGWIATRGALYTTNDGGGGWSRSLVVTVPSSAGGTASDLQCAPDGSVWTEFGGFGAATGHSPYVGYRCAARGACTPVVSESFSVPSLAGIEGPGSYPGPFSVLDAHRAVFVGNTPPLDHPMALMLLSDDGRRRGPVLSIPDGPVQASFALATSFVTADRGWVVDTAGSDEVHILATSDGGRTWVSQYGTVRR